MSEFLWENKKPVKDSSTLADHRIIMKWQCDTAMKKVNVIEAVSDTSNRAWKGPMTENKCWWTP